MEIAAVIIIICIALYLAGSNITLEKEYKRASKINKTLLDVAGEIENFESIDDLYERILCYTIELVENAQTGSILIYNEETDLLEYKAVYGFDMDALRDVRLKKEELFLYKTTKLKEPAIIKNPRRFDDENMNENSFKKLIESNSLDIRCTISSPIYIDGEFYGIINLDNKSREDAFNKKDILLLKYIVIQLEAAIKIVKLMDELKKISSYDHLTGLINRRKFEELYYSLLNTGIDLSLCLIDLDDFKIVNDTFGHKRGDDILKYFAKTLKERFDKDSILCRYAGDEFVILTKGNKLELKGKVEGIKDFLDKNPFDGLTIKFSVGFSSTNETRDGDKLITIADNEMYEEKRKSKSEVR